MPASAVEEKILHWQGNWLRRGVDAAFEGKTLEGETHKCLWHEIRSLGDLKRKPLRG